ncbi:epoxide hydrolase family protein [Actinomycetospora straminea]|uniref:Alpha/beta fold hydrolase n=1 Tax=Actinomycetospora straminea TaxID=663607 RepID=A0ABP9E7A4_9PSEU|nr:epoxide hydrolase [Actinomycetospora straminea]MDD7936502.1 epoxide hydrolase [Actinomycetospora straminea]
MAADAPVPAGDPAVEVVPFVLDVPEEQLADLRERLRRVRLPEPATDPSQGIGLDAVGELCRAWLEEHDWRRVEDELNRRGQFRTAIDGLGIHFLHVRSPRRDARPLLVTHGWPGSVVEVLDVLDALVDPGDGPDGQALPAFHVVAPSLPGYGFSDKPTGPGWGVERIADAWAGLMGRLGYDRFLAQGGDWGAMVTTALAVRHPDRVAMMHTTMPMARRPEGFDDSALSDTERQWLAGVQEFRRVGSGYSAQQRTRPQTLGYGLVDSPAGQLAWIAEKFVAWTDGDGFGGVPRDRVLDNAAIYWLTASGASSARLYWESFGGTDVDSPVTVPSAVSIFPAEMAKPPRAWVEARFRDLRHWNVLPTGGHFASLEVPGDFVDELRTAFARA